MEVNKQDEVTQNTQQIKQVSQDIVDKSCTQQNKVQQNQTDQTQNRVNKLESLQIYPELIMQPNKKQSSGFQLISSQQINSMNKTSKVITLTSLSQQQLIPTVSLQRSDNSQKPYLIHILSYDTTVFMGMSTQIFTIKVKNTNNEQSFQIKRRFSDFSDLYEQLFYNHPGYILYPFPDKNLESFIKLKLGLISQIGQRSQLIQKRINDLELFINWLAQHKQLRNSEQFQNFLKVDDKIYQEGRNRLNKYVSQYKYLQSGSQFRNILETSKSAILSYFNLNKQVNKIAQKNPLQEFRINELIIQEQIFTLKQKIKDSLHQLEALLKAERSFAQVGTMETDIDVLLNLSAKLRSGKIYYEQISKFLEQNILEMIRICERKLQEAQKSLFHWKQISQAIIQCQKRNQIDQKAKLQRRLQRCQKNFQFDWCLFIQKCKSQINQILSKFFVQWKNFKLQMKKIWKAK